MEEVRIWGWCEAERRSGGTAGLQERCRGTADDER